MKTSQNQLSLDFTRKNYEYLRKPNLQKVQKSNEYAFHKEASIILKDRFNIKFSYDGRSYLIKWDYKITSFKNFSDSSYSGNKVSNIHIEDILCFKSFFYSKYFATKKEELKFEKIIQDILNNIYLNPNLELNEEIKVQ